MPSPRPSTDVLLDALADATASGDSKARKRARSDIRIVLDERDNGRLRMGLAKHYRAIGAPAQAGRWGIRRKGWAKPAEVAALRHWLLEQAVEYDYVRSELRIDSDREVPAELLDLVDPAFREPFKGKESKGVSCGWLILAVPAALVAIVCFVILLWKVALEPQDLVAASQASVVVGGIALVVCLACALVLWLGMREPTGRARRTATKGYLIELAQSLIESGDDRGADILLRGRLGTADDGPARRMLLDRARDAGASIRLGAGVSAFPAWQPSRSCRPSSASLRPTRSRAASQRSANSRSFADRCRARLRRWSERRRFALLRRRSMACPTRLVGCSPLSGSACSAFS